MKNRLRFVFITVVIIIVFLLPACSPPLPSEATVASALVTPASYTLFDYSVVPGAMITTVGSIQEIPINNCGNNRDTSQETEVVREYVFDSGITVTSEVAAEFGGDINVAKVFVEGRIGAAFGFTFGASLAKRSAVTITAAANSSIVARVQVEEKWQTGSLSIKRPNGEYLDILPFKILDSIHLNQLGTDLIDCSTGKVITQVATQVPPISASPTAKPVENETTLQPVPTAKIIDGILPTIPVVISSETSLTSFGVDSTVSKVRTPLSVTKGEKITLEYVSGQWTSESGKTPMSEGCGIKWEDPYPEHIWPLRPEDGYGAGLIGYINNEPFWIGCNRIVTVPTTGQLYLGINDCQSCFWDNSGIVFFNIKIGD